MTRRNSYASSCPPLDSMSYESINIAPEQALAAWELIQECCGIDADEVGRMVGVHA